MEPGYRLLMAAVLFAFSLRRFSFCYEAYHALQHALIRARYALPLSCRLRRHAAARLRPTRQRQREQNA